MEPVERTAPGPPKNALARPVAAPRLTGRLMVRGKMDTRERLCHVLKKHAGTWVSGQELGRGLGLSRTAVWKHVRALRNEGYDIAASPRRGYRLCGAPDRLLDREVRENLAASIFGRQAIHHLSVTDSTNLRAWELAGAGAEEGTLVIAEQQTAGRGRRGRGWFSPAGEGIYLSLVLRPRLSPADAPRITLLAAVAAAEALRSGGGLDCRIRWPNDIVVGKRKLAGILTEIRTEMDGIHFAVLGLGVNVNTRVFPRDLEGRATSIQAETGFRKPRLQLLQAFLQAFESGYGRIREPGFRGVLARWEALAHLPDSLIRVTWGGRTVTGRARGIDGHGRLMVEDARGALHRVYSGDVIEL